MYSERSFPYFGYPPMSSAPWYVDDYCSYKDMQNSGPEMHQPTVFNIPIHVETPEGLVPLSRSTSHYPGSSKFRNKHHHEEPSSDYELETERIGETFTKNRSGPNPTLPPKPRFTTFHKPGYIHQTYYPDANEHNRVHHIPVQIEKTCKSQENVSHQNDSKQDVPGSDSKISVEPNLGKSSQESVESNIPMNGEGNQQNEKENKPVNQSKTADETKKSPIDPLDLIKSIKDEVCKLESEVNTFDGESLKQYRYLDEMLTRCMLKLDNIDSDGREDVRSARKSTLTYVDRVISILESKFNENKDNRGQEEATKTTETYEQQSPEINSSMEAESVDVDSTQQEPVEQMNEETNETGQSGESEKTNESEGQMEVENSLDQSKETLDNKPDEDQKDAIEEKVEDPLGNDDSSENCSDNQFCNGNTNSKMEGVTIEEMDEEAKPSQRPSEEPAEETLEEPPIKINRSDEFDDAIERNQASKMND